MLLGYKEKKIFLQIIFFKFFTNFYNTVWTWANYEESLLSRFLVLMTEMAFRVINVTWIQGKKTFFFHIIYFKFFTNFYNTVWTWANYKKTLLSRFNVQMAEIAFRGTNVIWIQGK